MLLIKFVFIQSKLLLCQTKLLLCQTNQIIYKRYRCVYLKLIYSLFNCELRLVQSTNDYSNNIDECHFLEKVIIGTSVAFYCMVALLLVKVLLARVSIFVTFLNCPIIK